MGFEFIPVSPEFKEAMEKMFSDEFMQKYTNFECFRDFKSSSSVFLNWGSAFMIYNAEVFDGFVKESTQFESWEEMIKTASEQVTASAPVKAPEQETATEQTDAPEQVNKE